MLVDPINAKGRLRSGRGTKDGLVLHDSDLALVRDGEYRVRTGRISRHASAARPRPIVNKEISVDDVVEEPPGTADDCFTSAGRSKGKPEPWCEIVQVARIESTQGLRRKCEPSRCAGKKGRDRVGWIVQRPVIVPTY